MTKSTVRAWSFVVGLGVFAACAEGEDVGGDEAAAGRTTGGGASATGGRFTFAGSGGSSTTGGSTGTGGSAGTLPGTAGGAVVAGAPGQSAGAGGEGGTAGPTEPEACRPSEGGAGGTSVVGVVAKDNSSKADDYPIGEFTVTNESDDPIELASLEARYYFESEHTPEETDALEVAVEIGEVNGRVYRDIRPYVVTDVLVLDPGVPSADAYVSMRFEPMAGSIIPGEWVRAQFRIHPPAGGDLYYRTRVDQTNDYSFGACPLRSAPWPRLVILEGSVILSGELPAGVGGVGGAGGEGGAGGAAGSGGTGG